MPIKNKNKDKSLLIHFSHYIVPTVDNDNANEEAHEGTAIPTWAMSKIPRLVGTGPAFVRGGAEVRILPEGPPKCLICWCF